MFVIPEILSQSEINELLKNLTSGEAAEPEFEKTAKRIREYDFNTPKKLAKEQNKILIGIFEYFARQLSSYLSGIMRAYSQVSVISVEEQHYFEYNNALPDTIQIGVIEAPPIDGYILADISNSITFNLLERMLGGGSRESNIIPEREFTEIENSLMERIFKQIAVFTKEAWSDIVEADVSLKGVETNARLVQSIPMDEIVVIILMEIMIGNVKGSINFCIPCLNIEKILNRSNKNKYLAKRNYDSNIEDQITNSIKTNIKAAPIEISAIFGETVLSLRDILNLQIGDVIKFDQGMGSQVKIKLTDGDTWFYGVQGVKNNKKVIRVNNILHKRGSLRNG